MTSLYISGYVQTIVPYILRNQKVAYQRKRIATPDNDFFDVDTLEANYSRAVVILHGLEGNSLAGYCTSTAYYLHQKNYDVHVINFRGCSGVPNLKFASYHSGFTIDLEWYLQALHDRYSSIFGIGFSLGGNALLKYLSYGHYSTFIKAAMAISVPLHLAQCARTLDYKIPAFYKNRFLHSLKKKIMSKKSLFPNEIDYDKAKQIHTFYDFDTWYTAPAFGYANADDYWQDNSALFRIQNINVPTLLLQAQNDPFLTPSCFPVLKHHAFVQTQYLHGGGHVGFLRLGQLTPYWVTVAHDFFETHSTG